MTPTAREAIARKLDDLAHLVRTGEARSHIDVRDIEPFEAVAKAHLVYDNEWSDRTSRWYDAVQEELGSQLGFHVGAALDFMHELDVAAPAPDPCAEALVAAIEAVKADLAVDKLCFELDRSDRSNAAEYARLIERVRATGCSADLWETDLHNAHLVVEILAEWSCNGLARRFERLMDTILTAGGVTPDSHGELRERLLDALLEPEE